MEIIEDNFDVIRENGSVEEMKRFTMKNKYINVQVISYGATITSLKIPDRSGRMSDIVLGFDDIKGYLNHVHYFGCTVGRFANRIAKGYLKIKDKEYNLHKNDGENHLHGGLRGFDKVIWDSFTENNAVVFLYSSPAGDQIYPSQINCKVVYEVKGNELIIKYEAAALGYTPINLTNHSYFNLGGHDSGKIHDHILQLNADYYTPVDEALIPTGEILTVNDTPYDFRKPQNIGTALSRTQNGFDLNLCVNGTPGILRNVGRLSDPKSGRIMEILTTQPGVQLYTGNALPLDNSLAGKDGKFYQKHQAVCLETQGYPDAVNHTNFPSCIIGPEDIYSQTTVFKFSVEQY